MVPLIIPLCNNTIPATQIERFPVKLAGLQAGDSSLPQPRRLVIASRPRACNVVKRSKFSPTISPFSSLFRLQLFIPSFGLTETLSLDFGAIEGIPALLVSPKERLINVLGKSESIFVLRRSSLSAG